MSTLTNVVAMIATEHNHTRSPFLRLPPEVRLKIYDHVLRGYRVGHLPSAGHSLLRQDISQASVCYVCKICYIESRTHFFNQTSILLTPDTWGRLKNHPHVPAYIASTMSGMQHIRIELNGLSQGNKNIGAMLQYLPHLKSLQIIDLKHKVLGFLPTPKDDGLSPRLIQSFQSDIRSFIGRDVSHSDERAKMIPILTRWTPQTQSFRLSSTFQVRSGVLRSQRGPPALHHLGNMVSA